MLSSLLIICLVNLHRSSPLIADARLTQAAGVRVRDMAANHYFSHTSPAGKNAWSAVGYSSGFHIIGEDLAKGFNSEEPVVNAWMNSPSHRRVLQDRQFKKTGVASYKGYTVELFGD